MFPKFVFIISRRLTNEQKALILSYAELDKEVDGTVNGLTQTKSGKEIRLNFFPLTLSVLCFCFSLGNRVVNEDDYPLFKSIKQVLSNLPLGSKKVANTIEEQETDTKRDSAAKKKSSSS